MEIVEIIELLFTFVVIIFIDIPKFESTTNKKKYLAVYYTVIAAGILLGMLEIFQVIPDYGKIIAFFFKKMFGI